jgi:hypothetical protein
MEFQCIAEGQNSRGLTIDVKKSDQPPLVCYPTSWHISHLQSPYSQCAMASPNSIVLILSSKEFMKKLKNYELKFCGKNPRYRFWIRKMLAYVADNSEQRMMN